VTNGKPPREAIAAVDPETLSRDELIALVRSLQQDLASGPAPSGTVSGDDGAGPALHYTIVFDGGSLGNPGLGYGSFEISGSSIATVTASELEFGRDMTNNQAEFHALIAALEQLLAIVDGNAERSSLAIRGDSQLVINGLAGKWRIKNPGLQPLYQRASALLRQFASVDLAWHPRHESVRTFGH
jgi:ribonuclease HI